MHIRIWISIYISIYIIANFHLIFPKKNKKKSLFLLNSFLGLAMKMKVDSNNLIDYILHFFYIFFLLRKQTPFQYYFFNKYGPYD